jgi:exodeoxyribonuclease VIII
MDNAMKKIYQDGVHDISNADYHASAGVSRSKLMLLEKSPYHFWHEVYSGKSEQREATPAMKTGSLFHTLLLEPELFDSEYHVIEQKTMPAKGTNPYLLIKEIAAGREVITSDMFTKAFKMASLIKEHEIVATLLDEAVFEQSIFWTDKETGIQFKARPDIWSEKMIVDLKTTADASLYKMQRAALDYGYYLQAGMAHEACKALGRPFDMFVILAAEKEAPHVPAVFMMDDDALQFGIDQFMRYKSQLHECMQSGKWPGYPVQELAVPGYAVKQFESDEE